VINGMVGVLSFVIRKGMLH